MKEIKHLASKKLTMDDYLQLRLLAAYAYRYWLKEDGSVELHYSPSAQEYCLIIGNMKFAIDEHTLNEYRYENRNCRNDYLFDWLGESRGQEVLRTFVCGLRFKDVWDCEEYEW
jgi:hypothetical protein